MRRLLPFAALLAACGPLLDGNSVTTVRIDRVFPNLVASTGGVEVWIEGHNFDEGTEVLLDGQPVLGLVRHSSTELTFVAPAHRPGPSAIRIVLPSSAAAEAEGPRYYAQQLSLAQETLLVPIEGAYAIWPGDFDGDLVNDVLVETRSAGQTQATVVLLTAAGTERSRTTVPLAGGDGVLAVGDLDGDRRADIVDRSAVYFANSDGSFGARQFAFTDGSEFGRAFILWRSGSAGGLALVISQRPLGNGVPRWLRVYEFDSTGALLQQRQIDGVPYVDGLVFGDADGDRTVDLFYRSFDGSFRVRLGPLLDSDSWVGSTPAGPYGEPFTVANATRDGCPDIISMTYSGLQVLVSNCDGTYSAVPERAGPPCWVEGFLPVNLNEIFSHEDIGAICATGETAFIQILDGMIVNEFWTTFPGMPERVRQADMNGDTYDDLLYVGPRGVMVKFDAGSLSWSPHRYFATTLGAHFALSEHPGRDAWLAVGDGTVEAYTLGGARLAYFLAGPDESVEQLATCDLDGDDNDELIALMQQPGRGRIAAAKVSTTGAPTGPTEWSELLQFEGYANRMGVGDFNGDQRCDLVVVHGNADALDVGLSGPEGLQFTPLPFDPLPVTPFDISLASGDLNADGFLDFLVGSSPAQGYLNDGHGHFNPVALSTPCGIEQVWPARTPAGIPVLRAVGVGIDFPEALFFEAPVTTAMAANGCQDALSAWAKQPLGFVPRSPSEPKLIAHQADFDGDGLEDVVVAPVGDNSSLVSVLRGTSAGTSAPATVLPIERPVTQLSQRLQDFLMADVDRDGLRDLIFTNGWWFPVVALNSSY